MTFNALLVSKDEDATEVLTPLLFRCGVTVACCGYPEALCRLAEEKFDSVIVDFDDPHSAALALQNASQTTAGVKPVTVALLGDKTKVRNVFGAGANFILYKPISVEQAESSLRAATALIKRERRRSYRVPVQVPIQLQIGNETPVESILLDLSEDGMDMLAAQPLSTGAIISAQFNLPDTNTEIQVSGEIAWASSNGQAGVRFIDLPESLRATLKTWVLANAPETLPPDPEPVSECILTDLSLGGCYIETESPFPERAGITLCLKAEDMEVQAEGLVRVMHPGFGMGIEFAARTTEERAQVARFIGFLTSRPGTLPALLITPRTLAGGDQYNHPQPLPAEELEDSLLELLRSHDSLNQEEFLQKLRQQRGSEEVTSA
ncbi:MAG TPA: PilZ domain-containing protein [Terriglobales bacterium]|jgi:CheY-like chemotaxis protein|nr:PilZ domain-containing protein [Terriglobales bacterium]